MLKKTERYLFSNLLLHEFTHFQQIHSNLQFSCLKKPIVKMHLHSSKENKREKFCKIPKEKLNLLFLIMHCY